MDATTAIYKQCFQTDIGKRVLANMMLEAGWFDYNKTPEEQAVENFVKTILCKCGFYNPNQVDELVTKLMSMSVDYSETEQL